MRRATQFCLVVLLWLASCAQGDQLARFAARFADGTRFEGQKLTGWHQVKAVPKLDDRALLDEKNPLRWLRDRTLFPGPTPTAFIETVCGDRLPCKIVDFRLQNDRSYEPLPDHFVVTPTCSLAPPNENSTDEPTIRVMERFIRRVVWQQQGHDQYRPGTVVYRDGRSAKCRAARFGSGFVDLLLEAGPRRSFFGEIAEIHLPGRDPWESYFDELAAIAPDANSRILQLETTDGLCATASLARLHVMVRGNPADSNRWVHGIQPAWSLDVLWIPHGNVWMRRMFAPEEVPLSRIFPSKVRQESVLAGAGWPWRANRNVHGGPLQNGGHDFGWGLGVHALCQMQFSLPTHATSFRSEFGLDRAAGPGGCVRASVFLNSTTDKPLAESGFLVGSEKTGDTGEIALNAKGAGPRTLILRMDPAHKGRPAGADPLDVRDSADWLDPVVKLDVEKIKAEIRPRWPKYVPIFKHWTLSETDIKAARWVGYWDAMANPPGRFAFAVAAGDQSLTLRRTIQLGSEDNWLLIVAHRHSGEDGPKVEVRVGGEPVAEFEVPSLSKSNPSPQPFAVHLADFRNPRVRDIQIEIVQRAGKEDVPVHWQAIHISNQLPTLYRLFEDDGDFKAVPGKGEEQPEGVAELIEDDAHSGTRSLKITPAGQFRRNFNGTIAIREKPGWNEYRFVRFAFRKYGAGRVCLELGHDKSADAPVRYDAGLGDPCWGQAKRVWVQQLPSEWIVMTRDLYADFGSFDVKSLTVSTPDGEYALFDHVYLARTQADFESIPAVASADIANRKARRELARPVLDKILPATVVIDYGDARIATGVVVSKDGDVLTAGHTAIGSNQQVTVHLADGRVVKARTMGVAREVDLALIKIDEAGPFPFVEVSGAEDLPARKLYVGVTHKSAYEPKVEPAAHIVDIRRVFRGTVWTSFDVEDFVTGGPIVDAEGKLLGIHSRRSQFGGFLYSRVNGLPAILPRLRKGEVWGTWPGGTGPMMGVEITSVQAGCQVTRVFPNTPAADAGIKKGDIITSFEGQSVVSLEDVYRLIADNDAGQQVAVEIVRQKKTIQATLKLGPRVP